MIGDESKPARLPRFTLAREVAFADRPPRPLRYVAHLRNGGKLALRADASGQLLLEVLLHEPAACVTVALSGEAVLDVVTVTVPLECRGDRARGTISLGPVDDVRARLGTAGSIEPLLFYPPHRSPAVDG